MYEPPEDARDIPHDAPSEWYIGASKISLLPDLKYGDKSKLGAEDEVTESASDPSMTEQEKAMKQKELKMEKTAKYCNIGTSTGCQGSVMTLSFHAKQQNVVKLYLYCHGQCIRFMPEDVKVVLPVLFNMNFGNNDAFLKGTRVDEYIEKMKSELQDIEFEAFQQSYM